MGKQKRYTHEQILAHLRVREDSGESVVAYCNRHGLSESTFWNWHKRYKADISQPARSPKASPIRVVKVAQAVAADSAMIELCVGPVTVRVSEQCSGDAVRTVLGTVLAVLSPAGVAR